MKKAVTYLLILIIGLGIGGGAAFGTALLLNAPKSVEARIFVPTGAILAPIVFPDGRLSGYASFEAQVEVEEDAKEDIEKRLPILLNAINMRSYRTPMTSGKDGTIPNITIFRKLVHEASNEAFGKDVVKRVVVTQIAPM